MTWPYAWGTTFVNDSGEGTDGTPLPKSQFDALRDELNANQQDATYPDESPAETTFQVNEAKGAAYANLKARLDAVASAANPPVPSPTIFSAYVLGTTAANILGSGNLVPNDDLLLWPRGDAAAPSHMQITGGATIARTGSGLGDTTTKVGPYSIQITFTTNPTRCRWSIVSATAAALMGAYKGQIKFGYGVWVWASTGNNVRAFLDDGVVVSTSAYHTGNSTWQFLPLSAAHTWNAAATILEVGVQIESAGSFYASGPCCVLGDIQPSRHFPTPTYTFDLIEYYAAGAVTAAALKRTKVPTYPCIVRHTQLLANTAPTGQALIVDVNNIDTGDVPPTHATMYTTKPQIAAAAHMGGAAPDGTYAKRCIIGTYAAGAPADGGGVSIDVDQVGSGAAGSDLSVVVTAMAYRRPPFLDRYGLNTEGV